MARPKTVPHGGSPVGHSMARLIPLPEAGDTLQHPLMGPRQQSGARNPVFDLQLMRGAGGNRG